MAKRKCKLEIGKFYYVYGGTMHPALIFEYDEKHKTYKSIKFGTTKRKHMTEIIPIQEGIDQSFVVNRPIEGVRDDYGNEELLGLKINEQNLAFIEEIKTKESIKTKRAKQRYK